MSLPFAKEKVDADLEKSMAVDSKNYHLHPTSLTIVKKLLFALIIESTISCFVYYYYDRIGLIHPMLAPAMLGCFQGIGTINEPIFEKEVQLE